MQWGETLSRLPVVNSRVRTSPPVQVRRWQGVDSAMDQPSLDHHFVSLHLGGPKRVSRRGDGGFQSEVVQPGAFSVVPAGAAYKWVTDGPIDFAHIYLEPKTLAHVISADFDKDPSDVSLHETLGARDPLLEALFLSMLQQVSAPDDLDLLYSEELFRLFVHHLLRTQSNVRSSCVRARHALAPRRLRRVLEFIEANLGEDIGLDQMAAATGVSPFHFSRSFRQAMGVAPYAFVIQRRVACAQRLLTQTELPLVDIARKCGFNSHSQFSRTFKRSVGASPRRFRESK